MGARNLSIGIVASIQTHGSLANWHPHLHLLVTDGGFRPDGTFVPLPLHDVATLTEAFRGTVLKLFVRAGGSWLRRRRRGCSRGRTLDSTHHAVLVPEEDRGFTVRLARYCARHPVALGGLTYGADSGAVTFQSDKPSGPTAGAETVDALEFLPRAVIDRILEHLRRTRAEARGPPPRPRSNAATRSAQH
ncbi:MAG: transposase [Gemmatimonadetes bacterium]|nr:transposase [Gemmatimonadota bacterium]